MSDFPIGPEQAFMAVRSGIESGMSATSSLRAFREMGGRIGNERWYALYGDVRSAVGNREGIQSMLYDSIPQAAQMTDWAAGEAGQQATFVQTYLQVPGERSPRTSFYIHVTDNPHTPQEAINAAQGSIAEGQRTGTGPVGEVMLGSVITSVARLTGRRSA